MPTLLYKIMLIAAVLFGVTSQAGDKAKLIDNIAQCPNGVVVLGSGGPIADDNRASSGYLIMLNGKARLLIDAGSGIHLRMGQLKVNFADIEAIGLSHFHTDHSADLPALLKSSYFTSERDLLVISGPSSSQEFPGVREFIDGLFNPKTGIYRYLNGALDGSDMAKLLPVEVTNGRTSPTNVIKRPDLKLSAVSVHHGIVPAVAYHLEIKADDKVFRIAITGDLSDRNTPFFKSLKELDLLIVDHAIPQMAGNVAKRLHMTPRQIGRVSRSNNIKHLVLSHIMQRSAARLDQSLEIIRYNYLGPVTVAEDRLCLPLESIKKSSK
jgi:ribonuclease BN (tRNA processing enzyme)